MAASPFERISPFETTSPFKTDSSGSFGFGFFEVEAELDTESAAKSGNIEIPLSFRLRGEEPETEKKIIMIHY
jgi:hypothetical protein